MNRKNSLVISMCERLIDLLKVSSDIYWRDRPWLHKMFTQKEIDDLKKLQKTEIENDKEVFGLIEELQNLL